MAYVPFVCTKDYYPATAAADWTCARNRQTREYFLVGTCMVFVEYMNGMSYRQHCTRNGSKVNQLTIFNLNLASNQQQWRHLLVGPLYAKTAMLLRCDVVLVTTCFAVNVLRGYHVRLTSALSFPVTTAFNQILVWKR